MIEGSTGDLRLEREREKGWKKVKTSTEAEERKKKGYLSHFKNSGS